VKKAIVWIAMSIITAASFALCGPYHTISNFTNSNFGLTSATLEFWNCDGQQWMAIKNSTSGGNGSYPLRNDLVASSEDQTKTFVKYTPNDGIQRELAIVIEEDAPTRIFIVKPDGTTYVVYIN